MITRLIIILTVSLSGVVALILSGSNLTELIAPDKSNAANQVRPAKTQRDTPPRQSRFDGLNPELKAIAFRLENAAIAWHKNRPSHDNFHSVWADWDQFSKEQISTLNTAQVQALVERYYDRPEYDYTEFESYRPALFYVWGLRDYHTARDFLIRIADESDLLKTSVKTWRNTWLDEVGDNFHHVTVGYAESNPSAAWQVFLSDMANPKMKYLVAPSVTPTGIFKNYASHSPEKCWEFILNTCDKEYHGDMLVGYTTGAPAGENWEHKYHELSQALETRDIENDYHIYQSIAERWATEAPVQALKWYSKIALQNGFDVKKANQNQFHRSSRKSAIAPSVSTSAIVELLDGMNISHRYHSNEVVAIIDQLLTTKHAHWAAASMHTIIGDTFYPWDIHLIELIPKIKDQTIRESLFLQAAEATPSRSTDTTATMNFNHPNTCYNTIRKLASTMDLSPGTRTQVETALLKVETSERKAQADKLKSQLQTNDSLAE